MLQKYLSTNIATSYPFSFLVTFIKHVAVII